MNNNLEISVALRLKNELTAALGKATTDMLKTSSRLHRDMANAGIRDARRFNQSYEALGIRSNRRIEQEIRRTEAAYDRLRRSGTLSMHEQGRAAEVTRKKVRELNSEMGKLSTAQKAGMIGRGAIGAVAGVAAAGYVLKPKVEQAMNYDLRLAHMSNTAYSNRDLAGRKAGMAELNNTVTSSLRYGGGTRDVAAGALDKMIASGQMPVDIAMKNLPKVLLAATATNADAGDFANIAVRAMTNLRIAEKDIDRTFNIGASGGQQGGFEIKDMSRHLPAQMALAGGPIGLSGTAGFAKLVAMNQAAAMAAGTTDEAGTNVKNLLAKINSRDTAMDAKKLGIDLTGRLAQGRKNGVDGVDTFVGLIRAEVQKDPMYRAISTKLGTTTDKDAKRVMYEDMANIALGKSIGSLIQDQQAMLALLPMIQNPQYVKDVERKALADQNVIGNSAALIKETSSFKTGQLGNEKAFAEQALFEKIAPGINAVADGMTSLAQKYPAMTTATVGATTALTALAAAAGAAGLANMLTGGGMLPGAGKLAGARAMMGGAAGMARSAGLVGLAGAGGYAVGTGVSKVIEGTAVSNAIGAGVARTLAFFGSKEAQEAVRLNSTLAKSQETPKATLDGTLRIIVDDQGRVSAVKVDKSFGPRFNIDTGYIMGGAG